MDLNEKMIDTGADVWYTHAFRSVLEDHLPIIKTLENNKIVPIEPMTALRWDQDFYGLLLHSHIPAYLHWVTMRANGYISPRDYNADTLTFLYLDADYLERLRSVHMSHTTIR